MGTVVVLPSRFLRFKFLLTLRIRCSGLSKTRVSRKRVLKEVDEKLALDDERAAIALVKGALGKPGGLACFDAARQVPQRLYTLDELKLNGNETSALLSPVDTTLGAIERDLQLAAVAGGLSAWNLFSLRPQQIFYISLALLSLWTFDAITLWFSGTCKFVTTPFSGCRSLLTVHVCLATNSFFVPSIRHSFLSMEEFPACFLIQLVILSVRSIATWFFKIVMQHEAGHFLIAYLVGILPWGYTISSLDALKKEGFLNVQAGTSFIDFEFLEEMLSRFSCIELVGVATEYLLFGCAEGGLADINKLDGLLKGLGFTPKKAHSQVRWSVLNTVLLLRCHESARAKLAEVISEGKSVGFCIDVVESIIDEENP